MTEARPRFATERDPSRPTLGPVVGRVASMLGTPLLPWQQLVADVALEYDPDRPPPDGPWRYPEVVVTVPRQSGKTVLLRAVFVHRAMLIDRCQAFMTAQLGKDASERWRDMVDAVEHGPLARMAAVRRSAGTEHLAFPNGSKIRPFAPGPKAVHGSTPHLVGIDEAWAFDAAEGEALMAAIRPAMITRENKQLWIISTAGTDESVYLRDLVDRGRLATQDPTSNLAYFEWSLDPARDTYDRDAWADFHPAVGHLITTDDLAAEAASMSRGNFERSYANRWTVTEESFIDLDLWDALTVSDMTVPSWSDVAIGYDVHRERADAAIWAAWLTPLGRVATRCLVYAHGTDWLVPTLRTLAGNRPRAIGATETGPVRAYTDELRGLGVEVETINGRDFGVACGTLTDLATSGLIEHDGSPAMRASIAAAALRPSGDVSTFSRRYSRTGIAPTVAGTVAIRLATNAEAPAPAPMIYA